MKQLSQNPLQECLIDAEVLERAASASIAIGLMAERPHRRTAVLCAVATSAPRLLCLRKVLTRATNVPKTLRLRKRAHTFIRIAEWFQMGAPKLFEYRHLRESSLCAPSPVLSVLTGFSISEFAGVAGERALVSSNNSFAKRTRVNCLLMICINSYAQFISTLLLRAARIFESSIFLTIFA